MASVSSSGEIDLSGNAVGLTTASSTSSASSSSSGKKSNSSSSSPNKYEKIRLLGTGAFGEAWLVKSLQSQRQYVIKELKLVAGLNGKDRERTFNEVQIIRKCCHVNIIRYKDCFIENMSHNVQVLSIVMEYADAGDLHGCIKRQREAKREYFAEPQVRNWLVQIAFAMQYLHKNNILHRDLKTQNIFMTSANLLKLGDFGISKTLSHENDFATTGIGTPQYLSPEICRSQKYSYKSDIWGLGCVLYEMCALGPAFPGSDFALLVQNIISGCYKPISSHFSTSVAELIKVMLRPDPAKRPTTEQILGAKVLQGDVIAYMESMAVKATRTTS